MQQVEITEKLYVNQLGALCFLSPDNCCPRSLSHQNRTRINNSELSRFMRSITGLEEDQIGWMCIEMAMEWLATFVTSDEGDIYRLLAEPEIIGWWKSHWNKRNDGMRLVLLDWYEEVHHLSLEAGFAPAECRTKAQRAALDKFTKLHRLAFINTTYQCRHLEESYAKLW